MAFWYFHCWVQSSLSVVKHLSWNSTTIGQDSHSLFCCWKVGVLQYHFLLSFILLSPTLTRPAQKHFNIKTLTSHLLQFSFPHCTYLEPLFQSNLKLWLFIMVSITSHQLFALVNVPCQMVSHILRYSYFPPLSWQGNALNNIAFQFGPKFLS